MVSTCLIIYILLLKIYLITAPQGLSSQIIIPFARMQCKNQLLELSVHRIYLQIACGWS